MIAKCHGPDRLVTIWSDKRAGHASSASSANNATNPRVRSLAYWLKILIRISGCLVVLFFFYLGGWRVMTRERESARAKWLRCARRRLFLFLLVVVYKAFVLVLWQSTCIRDVHVSKRPQRLGPDDLNGLVLFNMSIKLNLPTRAMRFLLLLLLPFFFFFN